jgi:hypothetical protein
MGQRLVRSERPRVPLREKSVLITKDLGIWPPPTERAAVFGLVLTRLDRLTPDARAHRVLYVVNALGQNLIGHITVVSAANIRTRHLDLRPEQ